MATGMSMLAKALRRSTRLVQGAGIFSGGSLTCFALSTATMTPAMSTVAAEALKNVPKVVSENTKPSDQYSDKKMNLVISGYPECGFFKKAQRVGHAYESKFGDQVSVTVVAREYEKYHEYRLAALAALGKDADSHKTCPLVYKYSVANGENGPTVVPTEYVGGCDSTVALLGKLYGELPEAKGPLWK